MADVKSMVRDPEFQALPWEERHQLLAMKDPEYSALSPTDQAAVMGDLKTRDWWKPAAVQTGMAPANEGFVDKVVRIAKDSPRLLAMGVDNVGIEAGQALDFLGAHDTGRRIKDVYQNRQKETQGTLAPETQRVQNTPIYDEKTGGMDWSNLPEKAVTGALQSAPDMVAALIPSTAALAGLSKLGSAAKITAAARKMGMGEKVAEYVGNFVSRGVAGGGVEGIQAGLGNAAQTEQKIREADISQLQQLPSFQQAFLQTDAKLPADQRAEMARDAIAHSAAVDVFIKTAPTTGALGVLTGGGATGMLSEKMAGKVVGKELAKDARRGMSGFVKSAGEGFGEEALQEGAQSPSEQAIQNRAEQQYLDPSTKIMSGIVNAGIEGAASGGVMGLAGGGASHFTGNAHAAQPLPADGPLSRAVSRAAAPVSPIGDIVAERRGMAGPATMSAQPAPVEPAAQPQPVAAPAPSRTAAPASGISDLVFQSRAQRASTLPANDGISAAQGVAHAESTAEGNQNADAVHAQGDAAQGNEKGLLATEGAMPPPLSPVDVSAHEAAASPMNSTTEPTPAQIEAGNYKKGHVNLHGLDISIENPHGSIRKGVDPNGKPWETTMEGHYGYIKGTVGKDKDHVDVFLKPNIDDANAGDKVFVVDQIDPKTGKLDEHKVLMGYASAEEAKVGYLANYDETGPQRIGSLVETTVPEFKLWLKDGDTAKEYTPVAPSPSPDTLTGEVSHDNGREVESVPAAVPPADTGSGDRGVEEGAKVPAAITKDKHAGNGSIVTDSKGKEYLVMGHRGNIVTTVPIVEGKAVVNADSHVKFNVNPEFAVSPESTVRTEPLNATGRNYYEEIESAKKPSPLAPAKELGKKESAPSFSPSKLASLRTLRDEIASGDAGFKVFNEGEHGSDQDVTASPSTFPDYFRNKGYTKKDTLNVINKAIAGKFLTEKQRATLDDLMEGVRRQQTERVLADRRQQFEDRAKELGAVQPKEIADVLAEIYGTISPEDHAALLKNIREAEDEINRAIESGDNGETPKTVTEGQTDNVADSQRASEQTDDAGGWKQEVAVKGEKTPLTIGGVQKQGGKRVDTSTLMDGFTPEPPSLFSTPANKGEVAYSLAHRTTDAFKKWSNNAPVVSSAEALTHEFKTGEKVVVEAFHGTARPDRVGTKFLKKRATSGPMAFFTSNPELASGYAQGKQDTSLANEDNDYPNWFKYKPKGARSTVGIDRAWYFLPPEVKQKISERMGDIRTTDDGDIIYEKGGGDIGSYEWELKQTQRGYDRVGNPLKAATETWLMSGSLFNQEEDFLKVLELAGFPVDELKYDPPHAAYPFVYKVYVAMQSPLVTDNIPPNVVEALNAAAKKDRTRAQRHGADMWDKNTRTLKDWVEEFNKEENQYVWTSIPDKVTELLKSLGYDGIIDMGGKGGGEKHKVYIPFDEHQVKSAIGNRGTYDINKNDIRYSTKEAPAALILERVQSSFPKQKVTEEGGVFTVTTPSGVDIRISKVGEIEFDRKAAEEAYGREILPNEKPVAEFRAFPDGAIINLTEQGVGELDHEAFHGAFALALNDRQRAAVLKSFGSEEKAAAEYQRLKDSGAFAEKKGHLFLRAIYDFFHRLRQLVAPTAKGVMQDVARGDVWKEADHRIVGSTKYASQGQTDTPAFKRWFGNSKVVDKDGKPLVVYHGITLAEDAGNNGDFDPNNPDIRYSLSRGDEIMTDEQRAAVDVAFGKPPTLADRAKEFKKDLKKNLVQGILDQYAPIKDLDMGAYIKARMTKGGDSTLEAVMLYGKPYIDGTGSIKVEFDSKNKAMNGFAAILSQLDGEHDRFLKWVAGTRAARLKDIGLENLMSRETIAALKTLNRDGTAENKLPNGEDRAIVYMRVLNQMNAYNDAILKLAVDRGLVNDATRQMYKDMPYIPFYRLQDEGVVSGFTATAGIVNQTAWKKLKGGTNKLNDDMLANMLRNWSHLITASSRNDAAAKILTKAVELGAAHEVPSGYPGKGGVTFRENTTTVLKKAPDGSYSRVQGEPLPAGTKYKEGGIEKVSDGTMVPEFNVERHFIVTDPHLLDAITSLGQVASAPKIMRGFKNILTHAVTINPTFKIRNLIRDSISSIALADLSYNPAKNIAKGLKLTGKESETRAQMMAAGGLMRFGSMLDGTSADNARKLIDSGVPVEHILDSPNKVSAFWEKYVVGAFDAYQEFGDRSEQVNRAALYQTLLDKGYTSDEAAFWARDLMDFSMSGKWAAIRFLNQTVPFMNARLQGLYKLGRSAKADKKRFGYAIGGVVLSSLALLSAYHDDDDWKKREAWDRDNYWWFKVGDKAFRIPKPFEIGAIGSVAEWSAELMYNKEMTGGKFAARMRDIISSQLNMNPTPQLAKPLIDLWANKDSFTNRPIESMGMDRLKPEDRSTDYTSGAAKVLGQLGLPNPAQLIMGRYDALSPVQIDSLVRGYFSWLGVMATTALDYGIFKPLSGVASPTPKLKDAFLVGNFVESLPSNQSRYLSEMYDQSKEIEQAYNSYRTAQKSGDTERAAQIMARDKDKIAAHGTVTKMKDSVADINRKIKQITGSRFLSSDQKREKIDALKQRQGDIAKRMAQQIQH